MKLYIAFLVLCESEIKTSRLRLSDDFGYDAPWRGELKWERVMALPVRAAPTRGFQCSYAGTELTAILYGHDKHDSGNGK